MSDREPTEASTRGYRAVALEQATDRLNRRLAELAPDVDFAPLLEDFALDRLVDERTLLPDRARIDKLAERIARPFLPPPKPKRRIINALRQARRH